jgi:predicted amidohydrolase YtcJ
VLGVKLYSDGWLGPRTAALRAPYSDHPQVQYTRDPFPFGILFLDQERAIRDVARADELGFNVTTHAIGDRGAETVLNAYEAVGVTRRDRWQLEHVQVMGDDLIERHTDRVRRDAAWRLVPPATARPGDRAPPDHQR